MNKMQKKSKENGSEERNSEEESEEDFELDASDDDFDPNQPKTAPDTHEIETNIDKIDLPFVNYDDIAKAMPEQIGHILHVNQRGRQKKN